MAKRLNNPDFKSIEFEGFKKRADLAADAFNRLRRPPYAFTKQGVGFAFSMMDIGAIEMLARLEGMK